MGFTKILDKITEGLQMKNRKKVGHCARNGNRPAPYTKYKKRPYPYKKDSRGNVIVSQEHRDMPGFKFKHSVQVEDYYLDAAE
jgi:hypothetical protein